MSRGVTSHYFSDFKFGISYHRNLYILFDNKHGKLIINRIYLGHCIPRPLFFQPWKRFLQKFNSLEMSPNLERALLYLASFSSELSLQCWTPSQMYRSGNHFTLLLYPLGNTWAQTIPERFTLEIHFGLMPIKNFYGYRFAVKRFSSIC